MFKTRLLRVTYRVQKLLARHRLVFFTLTKARIYIRTPWFGLKFGNQNFFIRHAKKSGFYLISPMRKGIFKVDEITQKYTPKVIPDFSIHRNCQKIPQLITLRPKTSFPTVLY